MTDAMPEGIRQLRAALGDRVGLPDSPLFVAALERVFFPDAARRRPACVVQPTSVEDVSSVMKIAQAAGCSVTVRGGGLSSNCVADDAIMIDLSAHLDYAAPSGDLVIMGGGATVGTMLAALAPGRRTVPIGIVRLAGMGLVTRGGVGYLTRSLGLTLDHLVSIELVLPSGEVVHLSDDSVGIEADLWWAARGSAPSLGVVTRATLRTHPIEPILVHRMVLAPDAVAAYFDIAPGLPRDTSMSAVIGTVPDVPETPAFLLYTACAGPSEQAMDAARRAAKAIADSSSSPPLFHAERIDSFIDGFPELSFPFSDGREPDPVALPEPGERAGFFFGKSVFLDATPGADMADALVERLRKAPTPACRIDFQQTGGALGDVGDTDTAFWGRTGEWNAPMNAISADVARRDECVAWAQDTVKAFRPHSIGVYSVEVRPGFPETHGEVAAAYGGNLPRLRELAERIDPTGVLDRYAPLGKP